MQRAELKRLIGYLYPLPSRCRPPGKIPIQNTSACISTSVEPPYSRCQLIESWKESSSYLSSHWNSCARLLLRMNLLLLHTIFSVLSLVDGQRASDARRGVRWLQEGISVLIRLETPSLPLWDAQERLGKQDTERNYPQLHSARPDLTAQWHTNSAPWQHVVSCHIHSATDIYRYRPI